MNEKLEKRLVGLYGGLTGARLSSRSREDLQRVIEFGPQEKPQQETSDYIHGYSSQEQDRLYSQSKILEEMVFDGVDFRGQKRILEIGCGVGAQTKILLDRFPSITVQGVDISADQIMRARTVLKEEIARGRASFELTDARRLPFPDGSFDGAFICWVLEHAADPLSVLTEMHRVLVPGAVVHGIEVMNASLHFYPACPSAMRYWDAMNEGQKAANGDPFVGAKMGNYLFKAGFRNVSTRPWAQHYDQRNPQALIERLDYWESLMLSAAPQLLAAGRVNEKLVQEMKREFSRLRTDPEAVFYYSPIKFSAVR